MFIKGRSSSLAVHPYEDKLPLHTNRTVVSTWYRQLVMWDVGGVLGGGMGVLWCGFSCVGYSWVLGVNWCEVTVFFFNFRNCFEFFFIIHIYMLIIVY